MLSPYCSLCARDAFFLWTNDDSIYRMEELRHPLRNRNKDETNVLRVSNPSDGPFPSLGLDTWRRWNIRTDKKNNFISQENKNPVEQN